MEQTNLTSLDNVKNKIYGAFTTCSQTDINFALQLLELICTQEENQSQLLQYISEIWGTVKSSKEIVVPERINKAKYNELELLYGSLVDGALNSYIRKGMIEGWERPQFYEYLWKFISDNIMLNTIEEKAFALYYILIDVRTPYYKVGTGLKMSADDFSNIQDEIFEAFREFRFIIALDHSQKTEEASLVLNIINRMETEEQKVVLLARIISYYNKRIERVVNEIENR